MDREQEEQEQGQGQSQNQQIQQNSIDRVNDLLGKARSFRNVQKQAQGGKIAGQAGKRIGSQLGKKLAAQGARVLAQAAAATAPIWGTVAVILLFFVILISVLLILFGGSEAQDGGSGETGSYECPVACQATACTGTSIPDTNATCSSSPTDICCIPQPPPGIQPPIKFYCQYDDKWETSTCKINKTGCTPTSVAMILASYGNPGINPLNTALSNTKNGRVGAGCFSGSSAYDFIPWIKSLGYTVGPDLAGGTSFDVVRAKDYISKGYYLLSGANILFNRSLSSGGPHAFVIGNIDSANIATVYDPTFCSTDTNYTVRRFSVFGFGGARGSSSQPLLSNSDGNYWFTVFPIKKL